MMFSWMGSAWRAHHPHFVVPAGSATAAETGASTQPEDVRAGSPAPAAGMLNELSGAIASTRALVSNFLDLLSLEARRAGLALLWMAVWGLVAAICVAAAWLGVMAVLVLWAVSLGFPPMAAVISVTLINFAAAVGLICACVCLSRDLLFSATRRQVAGKSPGTPLAP